MTRATGMAPSTLAPDVQIARYRRMLLIRRFEERVLELRIDGVLEGVVHPYIGQEAVAVGACAQLRRTDSITSTHRGHGHCIAKGADPGRMMAELYGRVDGYCGGKGGSMHIADFEIGMLGANGIVAAGLPIGAGAALASVLARSDDVTVCFFSEGAAGAGPFHEVLNVSALWRLPVVFLCENNGWAAENGIEVNLVNPGPHTFGAAYGVAHEQVDGNDVCAVYDATGRAIERARAGAGPTLLEARTFRLSGHAFRGARAEERHPDLIATWRARDPVVREHARLVDGGVLDAGGAGALAASVHEEVEAAIRFAESSPVPAPEDALSGFYAHG
jgi:acetoin:2,6-dichlorophenolindophenol oxidoreductase subunit alpha